MKVTKQQAQANRAHIVETASTLFRERGYDGVGIADLMAAAGFTQGGFYKHFRSKADLMAESSACGMAQSAALTAGASIEAFCRSTSRASIAIIAQAAAPWRRCVRMRRARKMKCVRCLRPA